MTKIDTKKIINYLDKEWGEYKCPICKTNKWSVGEEVFEMREFNEGSLMVGSGPIFPVIPVVCDKCGNILLLNAIKAGLIGNKKNDDKK